ncbi:MAG: (d)CMP kinase [Sulfuricella denitrificans]|nr:(d)CMP kinase [Sulfuricella denitrificans]
MNHTSHFTPHTSPVPVIAIDGPSASGKGTVAALVAKELGFHYLDSGAIYRVTALAAMRAGISLDDEDALAQLASHLDVRFEHGEIWLNGEKVGDDVRSEASGNAASRIAALPRLRQALLEFQRGFLKTPGLVADGRDMGSVVFPDATLKIFLTASAEVRAERRYKQLMEKGMHANLSQILQDLQQRDARDSARSVAPLQKFADAYLLETSSLNIAEAVTEILALYREYIRQAS